MAMEGIFRLGTTQVVAFSSTSAANTTAFKAGTNVVRVVATKGCHVTFAAAPTAVAATHAYVPAGIAEYFIVSPGEKIAAIRTATSGNLYVTEVS